MVVRFSKAFSFCFELWKPKPVSTFCFKHLLRLSNSPSLLEWLLLASGSGLLPYPVMRLFMGWGFGFAFLVLYYKYKTFKALPYKAGALPPGYGLRAFTRDNGFAGYLLYPSHSRLVGSLLSPLLLPSGHNIPLRAAIVKAECTCFTVLSDLTKI